MAKPGKKSNGVPTGKKKVAPSAMHMMANPEESMGVVRTKPAKKAKGLK